jgi:putative ABC transport system permease protein
LLAQSHGESASIASGLREVIRGLDPNIPVFEVLTMEDAFAMGVVGPAQDVLVIVGAMGLTGLVLAMIGLYGLVAYSVSRRTREFGIRLAIGANRSSVLRMVLREGWMLCFAGIVLGIAVSVPASRVLKSVTFAANTDWVPYVLIPIVLSGVTLIAAFGPARRAARIDPMRALRDE